MNTIYLDTNNNISTSISNVDRHRHFDTYGMESNNGSVVQISIVLDLLPLHKWQAHHDRIDTHVNTSHERQNEKDGYSNTEIRYSNLVEGQSVSTTS